jgi:tRNA A37 threonylcarbamoyladenosine synthetase subunit TsaC/SUA5/YrdC
LIYLSQTDTTVGFLSTSAKELANAKGRDINQPFIICVDSFDKLKRVVRVPKKDRRFVRRAKKTTFIYPNGLAVRVVKDHPHSRFLKRFDYIYSTSANRHKESFDKEYALETADVVVMDRRGFSQKGASAMIRVGKKSKKIIRKL